MIVCHFVSSLAHILRLLPPLHPIFHSKKHSKSQFFTGNRNCNCFMHLRSTVPPIAICIFEYILNRSKHTRKRIKIGHPASSFHAHSSKREGHLVGRWDNSLLRAIKELSNDTNNIILYYHGNANILKNWTTNCILHFRTKRRKDVGSAMENWLLFRFIQPTTIIQLKPVGIKVCHHPCRHKAN